MQAKSCVSENILVVPIPGPCALVSALSASGLPTDEFTFGNLLAKLLLYWLLLKLAFMGLKWLL